MRLLRILRPLRFISHDVGMKLIVTALLESVSGIINVLVVIILIWMMFGILAVNLLGKRSNYCDIENGNEVSQAYEFNIYELR